MNLKMKAKENGAWRPLNYRPPMLGNLEFRPQLGVPMALPIIAKWGLPWLLTAGGIAVTAFAASKALPEIPINKERIGIASALAGGGLTAYFLSSTMPQEWQPLAYAAAVAGVSAAAYLLFTKGSEEKVPRGDVPAAEVVPASPREILETIKLFPDTAQNNTGGYIRSPWIDQTYEIVAVNEGLETRTFFAGVDFYQEGVGSIYKSPMIDPNYGRKRVTLPPGKQEVIEVTVPSRTGVGGRYAMTFELYRQQANSNEAPFMVSGAVPINYNMLIPFLGQVAMRQGGSKTGMAL